MDRISEDCPKLKKFVLYGQHIFDDINNRCRKKHPTSTSQSRGLLESISSARPFDLETIQPKFLNMTNIKLVFSHEKISEDSRKEEYFKDYLIAKCPKIDLVNVEKQAIGDIPSEFWLEFRTL